MVLNGLIHRTLEFIPILHGFVWSGLILSAILSTTIQISDRFEADIIDESVLFSIEGAWDNFYSEHIDPVGRKIAFLLSKILPDQTSYFFGSSITGIAFSMSVYILSAGILLGAGFVSYFTFGKVPTITPFIEILAAGSVTLGLATIFEAANTSEYFA